MRIGVRRKARRLETAQQAVQVAGNQQEEEEEEEKEAKRQPGGRPQPAVAQGPTPPDSHCCWLPGGVPTAWTPGQEGCLAWTFQPGSNPMAARLGHLQRPSGLL